MTYRVYYALQVLGSVEVAAESPDAAVVAFRALEAGTLLDLGTVADIEIDNVLDGEEEA